MTARGGDLSSSIIISYITSIKGKIYSVAVIAWGWVCCSTVLQRTPSPKLEPPLNISFFFTPKFRLSILSLIRSNGFQDTVTYSCYR